MFLLKSLMTELIGVSLCMANISGIVTDTGSTPVQGAVVRLENGSQTATTGTDGSFVLNTATTAVVTGNSRQFQYGLSAGIYRSVLNVTTAERSVVEVAMFDLNGKSLFTVRRSMDAGCHSISLPCQGTGIYLYKVKAGNREIVLRGNPVNKVASRMSVVSQGSVSKTQAKQATEAAATNAVLVVTKDSLLVYRMAIGNTDTTGVTIKMIACAGTITDADENVYQTVRIGSQEWTVENLRTTKYRDGTAIPQVTDSIAWFVLSTPGYCYFNNATDSNVIKKYGALYNWQAVNPSGSRNIAPEGWHVPTDEDWGTMQNYLITKGYNWDATTTGDKIAKALAAKTDWAIDSVAGTTGCHVSLNNSTGFSALPCGYRYADASFVYQNEMCGWWTTTGNGASKAYSRNLYHNSHHLGNTSTNMKCGYCVRLVRAVD